MPHAPHRLPCCRPVTRLWRPRVALCNGSQSVTSNRKKAMSAVSSESPRAAADLSEPSSSQPAATATAVREAAPPGREATSHADGASPASAAVGANEWLGPALY